MFFDSQQRLLARRSEALQRHSAMLRGALALDAEVLTTPLARADQLLAGVRWLKAHPQWVGLGTLALVLLRPRRAWQLGLRLWTAWRLWRRVQRWRDAVLLPGAIRPNRPDGR